MEKYIGQQYNRWTLIKYVGVIKSRKSFLCKCSCGTEKIISFTSLKSGSSKSCGCLRSEKVTETNLKLTGVNGRNYKPDSKITITCEWCKEEFERLKCNLKNSEFNYCSLNCRAQHQKTFLKGENHPLYIKDRTLIVNDRRSEEGNKWRLSVFKKDNYMCNICKQFGVIHAHHLKSFNMYVEDRYNIDNGITLCEEHHIEFHRNYGYKNFTIENYYEFKVKKGEEYEQ